MTWGAVQPLPRHVTPSHNSDMKGACLLQSSVMLYFSAPPFSQLDPCAQVVLAGFPKASGWPPSEQNVGLDGTIGLILQAVWLLTSTHRPTK